MTGPNPTQKGRGQTRLEQIGPGLAVFRTPQFCVAEIALPHLSQAQVGKFWRVFSACIVGLLMLAVLSADRTDGDWSWSTGAVAALFLAFMVLGAALGLWHRSMRRDYQQSGAALRDGLARMLAWSKHHPDWGLRVFETPQALYAAVTHRAMAPSAPELRTFASGLNVDPMWLDRAQKGHEFSVMTWTDEPHIKVNVTHLGSGTVHPEILGAMTQFEAALGLVHPHGAELKQKALS